MTVGQERLVRKGFAGSGTEITAPILGIEQDVHVNTARELVNNFGTKLEGHMYGSPQVVHRQMDTVGNLLDMISDRELKVLDESSEESLTFMDLPKEVISLILRKLPDHISLLETAKAHEIFEGIIQKEERMWDGLSYFHFTQEQIDKHRVNSLKFLLC